MQATKSKLEIIIQNKRFEELMNTYKVYITECWGSERVYREVGYTTAPSPQKAISNIKFRTRNFNCDYAAVKQN